MISVLGFPLRQAVELLQTDGFAIRLLELSCKKGSRGDSDRVVRQQTMEDGSVVLTYSRFLTII